MPEVRPLTILCVTSFEKGQEFIRTCKAIDCRVLLLTVETLRHANWPFECIDEVFTMPEELPLQGLIYSVSYTARSRPIDRIVALDEFDMENVSALREFMTRVPGPWLLKPRSQASGIGMKKIQKPEELWPWLDQLGDQQSFYLLEQFVPGSVYHVDSVTSDREVVFAETHAYA